jgi:hypothetical protein
VRLSKRSPRGRPQTCSLGRYSSSDALGPPQTFGTSAGTWWRRSPTARRPRPRPARVGPAPSRIERHALGPLHLGATEPLRGVGVRRYLVGAREVNGVRLETREVPTAAGPCRRTPPAPRSLPPATPSPLATSSPRTWVSPPPRAASERFNWRDWEWSFRSARGARRSEAAAAALYLKPRMRAAKQSEASRARATHANYRPFGILQLPT